MDDYPIHDDEAMLEIVGYTREELVDMLIAGEDIGAVYDGDPVALL